jgi:hypothetical protein
MTDEEQVADDAIRSARAKEIVGLFKEALGTLSEMKASIKEAGLRGSYHDKSF